MKKHRQGGILVKKDLAFMCEAPALEPQARVVWRGVALEWSLADIGDLALSFA